MTRIKLTVWVDLDPVPGAFHTKESAQNQVQMLLERTIHHYKPIVLCPEQEVETHQDYAVQYRSEATLNAIMQHLHVEHPTEHPAIKLNQWFVRSTDPNKTYLILPDHIFRRCFRVDIERVQVGLWTPVKEIA